MLAEAECLYVCLRTTFRQVNILGADFHVTVHEWRRSIFPGLRAITSESKE